MKYKPHVYEDCLPFGGDESDVRAHTVKIVRCRTRHPCMFPSLNEPVHYIEPGRHAVREHAVVDGEWCSSYVCIPCMDGHIADLDDFDADDLGEAADAS